jgi:hypothetical protein
MNRILPALLAILLVALGAEPAAAQRSLNVPADKGWQHARTGLILRSKLAGMDRTKLLDSGTAELDISAEFQSSDNSGWATIFLFRPALQSVPIWFDRSESQIQLGTMFAPVLPVADTLAFARPGAVVASGLRRVYRPSAGGFRSTALAIVPLGEWLVAVRISSKTLEPVQMDARLSAVIAAIGWPKDVAESPAAVPVATCAKPLAYAKRARMNKPDVTSALMGAALALPDDEKDAKDKAPAKPAVYCRDLPPRIEYGVYREPTSTNAYVMALGDAGIVASVGPSLAAMFGGGPPAFDLSLADLEGTSIYPSVDKLIHPDQVLGTIGKASPMSRTTRGEKNITINAPSK